MTALIYGLVTGILFGFFLQKSRVIRFDKQLGAFRFIDLTIVKFMVSIILVVMIVLYLLQYLGWVKLSVKSTNLGANIVGGLIFGLGWGLLGYCPGTSAGALGEGRWDALWGILGMIAGAAIFAETFPILKKSILTWGDFGKITLPQIIGVNHWIVILVIVVCGLALFVFFEKKRL